MSADHTTGSAALAPGILDLLNHYGVRAEIPRAELAQRLAQRITSDLRERAEGGR